MKESVNQRKRYTQPHVDSPGCLNSRVPPDQGQRGKLVEMRFPYSKALVEDIKQLDLDSMLHNSVFETVLYAKPGFKSKAAA